MPRLIDELADACRRLGRRLPAEPRVFYGGFADLCWEPAPELYDGDTEPDPAVEVVTGQRWVVMHRIHGQIRYFAGARPNVATLFSPAELGIFPSPDDAAELTAAYLEGAELDDIPAARRLPDWALQARRRENPWPPIDPAQWQRVAATRGRVAAVDDVDQGRAVFVLQYLAPGQKAIDPPPRTTHGTAITEPGALPGAAEPIGLPLPRCALLHEDGDRYPAVAIQAERSPKSTYVGLRFIRGGYIVRPLDRVELVDAPTARFFHEYAQALARAARGHPRTSPPPA